jgi:hypothetical protein
MDGPVEEGQKRLRGRGDEALEMAPCDDPVEVENRGCAVEADLSGPDRQHDVGGDPNSRQEQPDPDSAGPNGGSQGKHGGIIR